MTRNIDSCNLTFLGRGANNYRQSWEINLSSQANSIFLKFAQFYHNLVLFWVFFFTFNTFAFSPLNLSNTLLVLTLRRLGILEKC